jgi:hypothetical protein
MAALPLMRDRGVSALRAADRAAVPADARPSRRRAAAQRPSLALVEAPRRRRWPVLVAGAAWTCIVVGLLSAAVFHTQLAERQLEIDRLERSVNAERERFDELRYQRAELRSPVRLAEAATALGMHRGRASTFVSVEADALARQLATAGHIDDTLVRIVIHTDPLDQFRSVKEVTEAGS